VRAPADGYTLMVFEPVTRHFTPLGIGLLLQQPTLGLKIHSDGFLAEGERSPLQASRLPPSSVIA
jgi:hypothetical protein